MTHRNLAPSHYQSLDIEATEDGFVALEKKINSRLRSINSSIDGRVWTNCYWGSTQVNVITIHPQGGYALGDSEALRRQPDGSWTKENFLDTLPNPSPSFNDLHWTGTELIAVGDRGEIYTLSPNCPPPARYFDWAQANQLSEFNNNPDDDPDGDGLANLVEMALGTHPLRSQSEFPDLTMIETEEGIEFSFSRPSGGVLGVKYSVEFSDDMITWDSTTNYSGNVRTFQNGAGFEEYSFSFSFSFEPENPLSIAQLFMSLRVVLEN